MTARDTALTTAQTELANAVARANTIQTQLVGMILDSAVRENRITLAQRDHWKGEFEKDFAAAETQIANQQPVLNTESATRELGNEKGARHRGDSPRRADRLHRGATGERPQLRRSLGTRENRARGLLANMRAE